MSWGMRPCSPAGFAGGFERLEERPNPQSVTVEHPRDQRAALFQAFMLAPLRLDGVSQLRDRSIRERAALLVLGRTGLKAQLLVDAIDLLPLQRQELAVVHAR